MKVQHKLASGPLRRQGETLTDRQVLPMPHSAGGRGTPCALGREYAASPGSSLFKRQRTRLELRRFVPRFGFADYFWVDDTFGYARVWKSNSS